MISLSLALFFLISPAQAAIELSLESNRVERGNIGYVDMEALFQQFPETIAAKKKFKADLQKAEDKINLEKIGVLHIRQDLSELRMERRYALKNQKMSASAPSNSVSSGSFVSSSGASGVSLSTPLASSNASALSASPHLSSSTAAHSVSLSSPAAQAPLDRSLISAMPGFEAARSSSPVHEPKSPSVSVSSATAGAQTVLKTSSSSRTSVSLSASALAALNLKIEEEKLDLSQKQAALKQDESIIEKSLLNLENRETEGLLGGIYKVIREVAAESGVSVVVDKSQILYGHDAVDLTGKVLKRLKVLKASGGFHG